MKPANERRILLCATGLSPQVVTETLYALAVRQRPAWVPSEIHIITTREGAHRARLTLMQDGKGAVASLCADYTLRPPRFDETCLHVVQGADGKALEDIHDADDNTACADAMVRMVREFSADAHSALHVSIAGGRKTMGYLLGYALTLFGRPQDRLSHVLVDADFESHPEFFYPTPHTRVLYATRDQRPLDAKSAQVQLVDIPFVSLRSGVTDQLASDTGISFSEAVRKATVLVATHNVRVDVQARTLHYAEFDIALKPLAFLVWLWLALRAQHGEGPVSRHLFNTDPALRTGLCRSVKPHLAEMSALAAQLDNLHDDEKSALNTDGSKWLGERVNEINKDIEAALGTRGRTLLGVATLGPRARSVYALNLSPGRIEFV